MESGGDCGDLERKLLSASSCHGGHVVQGEGLEPDGWHPVWVSPFSCLYDMASCLVFEPHLPPLYNLHRVVLREKGG